MAMLTSTLLASLEEEMTNPQGMDYSLFFKLEEVNVNTSSEETFKTLGDDWKYCAEGNCNIVIALPKELRVLRLRKQAKGQLCEEGPLKRKLLREVFFFNNIFRPLLGAEFIGSIEIIRLGQNQIVELNQALKKIRPRNRLHKELGVRFATSRTDFTRIHSNSSIRNDYCVEIKPKQGCWNNRILKEETNLCTFCLHQFLKLKKKKITDLSSYCPMDFFSGEPNRLIGALKSLILNPQNNFRIFRNSELVYGENMPIETFQSVVDDWILSSRESLPEKVTWSSLDNFLYLVSTALLKPQESLGPNPSVSIPDKPYKNLQAQLKESLITAKPLTELESKNQNYRCNASSDKLSDKSILSRLLSAQRLGDWGYDLVYSLYNKICPVHNTRSNDSQDNSIVECPSSKCLVEEKWLDELVDLPLTKVELLCVENFLVSATVKDSSLMLTFSPEIPGGHELRGEDHSFLQDLDGGWHKLKIGVADLDPKPVSTIAKHYSRDLEMLKAYKTFTTGA